MSETSGPWTGAPRGAPVLAARALAKRYGSTHALRGVDVEVMPGEVLGLVGANGAGKSTLIKVFSGAERPTGGHVEVAGARVEFASPQDASRAGVETVHQDVNLSLVPALSVAENLVLDQLAAGSLGPLPSASRIREAAGRIAAGRLGVDLGAPVSALSASQRQQLLIARALSGKPVVLILDEPTAALSVTETERLVRDVRELAVAGTAVVHITHRLGEVVRVCDRVVALRDGLVTGEFTPPLATSDIAAAILGPLSSAASVRGERHRGAPGAAVLSLRGVRSRPAGVAIGFEVRSGEVLGITGLIGSGKSGLLRQIVGASELFDGEMSLAGQRYRPRHPADAVAAGIGFVPEDRTRSAEFPGWDITANLTLPDLRRYRRWGLLSRRAERAAARTAIEELSIVAAGPDAPINSLSGGNRQKVMVARWLAARSRLLVLDEPFRGVDIRARADIAHLLRSGEVASAVVASSDPEEIIEVADRILVMSDGGVVGEVDPTRIDAAELTALMTASPD